jgi:hypothetical protein
MKTKKEAKYEPTAMGTDECRVCTHYFRETCEIVEGKIAPGAWCRFFKRSVHKK